jgi:hypothetical protein
MIGLTLSVGVKNKGNSVVVEAKSVEMKAPIY